MCPSTKGIDIRGANRDGGWNAYTSTRIRSIICEDITSIAINYVYNSGDLLYIWVYIY